MEAACTIRPAVTALRKGRPFRGALACVCGEGKGWGGGGVWIEMGRPLRGALIVKGVSVGGGGG